LCWHEIWVWYTFSFGLTWQMIPPEILESGKKIDLDPLTTVTQTVGGLLYGAMPGVGHHGQLWEDGSCHGWQGMV
jgi:hypothetical protein